MKSNGKEHSISRGDQPDQGIVQAADRRQRTVTCPCLGPSRELWDFKAKSPATVERAVEKQKLATVVERKETLHNARAGTSGGV